MDLVLADQVPDGGVRDHDLAAPAPGPSPPARGTSVLRHHALQHERELGADLRLLVRREDVDDAVDGLDALLVWSVAKAR